MKDSFADLMKHAQAMQEQLQQAQSEIAKLEITGEAGAGLVKVVMNGRHELKRVNIEPALLEGEKDMLEDLIAAAVNDAGRRLERISREKMSSFTAGLNLPAGIKLPF
jgi:hypothetical protein